MKIVIRCGCGHDHDEFTPRGVRNTERAVALAQESYLKDYGFGHGRVTIFVDGEPWQESPHPAATRRGHPN